MNKKKLPKAIVWTASEMQAKADNDQRRAPPALAVMNEPPTRNESVPHNVIEMVPKSDTASATAPAPDNSLLAQRRSRARAIIERHANLSAVGGIIPFPIANVAGVTALIVHMVKSLSALYGVPFERNRARAIIVGSMGGVMPAGLASVATSTLIYFVPGCNLIGLAVSSVTASAYARGIGQMFIEHFETGSSLIDFPSAVLR